MSARLLRSSSQFLTRTFPIQSFPFSVGFLSTPMSAGAGGGVWGVDDGTSMFIMHDHRATQWGFYNGTNHSIGDSQSYGKPYYVLIRAVTTTNLRISILNPDGTITHDQITGATGAFAGPVTEYIGQNISFANAWYDGRMDGYFAANVDVQGDGAPTNEAFLRQLAALGPLSFPHIVAAIRAKGDYRSFRSRIVQNDPAEVMWGGQAPPLWTNNNGVMLGPDNPYTAGWVQPNGDDGILPIYIADVPVTPPAAAARRRKRGGFIVNVGGLMGR